MAPDSQIDAIADHVRIVVQGRKAQGDTRVIGQKSRHDPAERELRDPDRTGQGDSAFQRDLVPPHGRFGSHHAVQRHAGMTKKGLACLGQRHVS